MDQTQVMLQNHHEIIMKSQDIIFEAANDTLLNQELIIKNQIVIAELITNLFYAVGLTLIYATILVLCSMINYKTKEWKKKHWKCLMPKTTVTNHFLKNFLISFSVKGCLDVHHFCLTWISFATGFCTSSFIFDVDGSALTEHHVAAVPVEQATDSSSYFTKCLPLHKNNFSKISVIVCFFCCRSLKWEGFFSFLHLLVRYTFFSVLLQGFNPFLSNRIANRSFCR